MARIRTIKPEFVQSESVGRLSRDARLLFILIWTVCDDEGRLRGNSRMLARTLYPYDDGKDGQIDTSGSDVERWMLELEQQGCVQRYESGGDSYLSVCNWLKHQKIDKPSASKLPPAPRVLAKVRERSSQDQDQDRDQEGKGSTAPAPGSASADPPPLVLSPVEQASAFPLPTAVITIPTNTGEEYPVYQPMVDEYASAYPAVDVPAQLREMRIWSISNPNQRKTKQGMQRFINGWLSKEQNRPRGRHDAGRGHGLAGNGYQLPQQLGRRPPPQESPK